MYRHPMVATALHAAESAALIAPTKEEKKRLAFKHSKRKRRYDGVKRHRELDDTPTNVEDGALGDSQVSQKQKPIEISVRLKCKGHAKK